MVAIGATAGGYYVVASHDGGKTFDATHLLDTPDILTGIEIARSKPGVVYATSVSTSGGASKFFASTNFGAPGSWTTTTLAVSNSTQPRILAIDPADEKKVYLRLLNGPSDGMSVTADGGQTFQTVLPIPGPVFLVPPRRGRRPLRGTRDGKLYTRPAGAPASMAGGPPRTCAAWGSAPGRRASTAAGT